MSAPNPLPKYVYKIIDTEPTSQLLDELPLSDLDSKDGFIHLSVAKQVPNVAGLFFEAHTTLWVLKLPLASLGRVEWEGSDDQGRAFPHLYGRFGGREVVGIKVVQRSASEGWRGIFERDDWLE
ncbi:unnamed protein product [Parascedosporium putredinis]|uniref:DUF952 domain-containing protein n=1 Tax=Parascedosporium putredinis TaxID=1442378 RepID=A0A9P1H4Q1_9PEZI|nr:unnamed protein product [Parascedosporium putredinis]CAI7995747.1 unnamed protein product [Parascedosporium putredinis]